MQAALESPEERFHSIDHLRRLFEQHFRTPAEHIQPLRPQFGGSGRRLLRLSGGKVSAIGVVYEVRQENVAFLEFSRHFRKHGLAVPEIYAEDLAHGVYLEEDLGEVTLFDFLSQHRHAPPHRAQSATPGQDIESTEIIDPEAIEAYRQTILALPRFQIEAGRGLNYKFCYPRRRFDRQSMVWDLNYFKYCFLRPAGVPFNEQALEEDFSRLIKFLLGARRDFFLYRDYQSRNVMLHHGKPYFLDYQGGRQGALQYDVASLLYDAKADLPPELRQRLLDEYLDALPAFVEFPRAAFMQHYYAFVYIRIMQALGAYGFRGFYEGKAHFLQSVPYALKNLSWLLNHAGLPIPLPALLEVFQNMPAAAKLQNLEAPADRKPAPSRPVRQNAALASDELDHLQAGRSAEAAPAPPLRVTILSFSFHRGVPQDADESGNGGGFVFDCRSLGNPGREEHFRAFTGKDKTVMEYLNRQESVRDFLAAVTSLVDAGVSNYLKRGFTRLLVSFGCTGGQHRSVYLAERLAEHLRSRDGVQVIVRHRELEGMGSKRRGEAVVPGMGR